MITYENKYIGNKTQCDICNSKAARKARKKDHKEASPPVDGEHTPDESPHPPTTPPPVHEEGITPTAISDQPVHFYIKICIILFIPPPWAPKIENELSIHF